MTGLNRFYLIGRVTEDPDVRTAPDGSTVVKLGLSTTSTQKVGDAWVEEADLHLLTARGALAETLARTVSTGSTLAIEGEIHPRRWITPRGTHAYAVDLVITRILYTQPPKKD